MHPRIAEVLTYLDTNRAALERTLKEVPPASRERRPASERWSVAEVIQHLALVEGRITELLASRIEEELDDLVYSSQGETLEQIVLYYLEMKGATLSVAESCTGGIVSERLTSISGSSRSFVGGAIV